MLIILFCIFALVFCNQYVPIPNKPLGVAYGDSKKLIIEAFYDLACPDSKESFGQLDQLVGTEYATRFKYVIHMFPLPYHQSAFPAGQGLQFLAEQNINAAYLFAKKVFENQALIAETAIFEQTRQQVFDTIADIAAQFVHPTYPYDQVKFAKALLPSTESNLKARYWWKYGTYRTISGAPVFLVNGVILDGAENFKAADWQNFIDEKNPKTSTEL